MYTGTASSCLVFLALGFLTFVHSVTSLPVQTNTWVTADQHEDSYSRGQWGVFAKEVQTSLLNPSHVNKINVSISMNLGSKLQPALLITSRLIYII